jgi:hypothetical protein
MLALCVKPFLVTIRIGTYFRLRTLRNRFKRPFLHIAGGWSYIKKIAR